MNFNYQQPTVSGFYHVLDGCHEHRIVYFHVNLSGLRPAFDPLEQQFRPAEDYLWGEMIVKPEIKVITDFPEDFY